MKSQKVQFSGAENVTLSGILEVPEGEAHGWAIFAHCFTCSKVSLASSRIARGLAQRGIGVLRFDFTGLGESDGEFSNTAFSTNVADLIAAAQWMAQQDRAASLLVGHSLGGAAAIMAAGKLPEIAAIATIGAPSDPEHVIHQFGQHVPEIEARGEAKVDLGGRPFIIRKSFLEDVRQAPLKEALQGLKRPLLVMHSPIDRTVDIENATGLFVNARHPKSFVSLDDADHLLTRVEDAEFVSDVIFGWAQRYIDTSTAVLPSGTAQNKIIVQETRQSGPYQNEMFIDGRRYLADEPVSVGGSGSGPDPYALVTAGLGACTSMTLRMYANQKGWPLERVMVTLDHIKQHAKDCTTYSEKNKIDVFSRQIQLEGPLDDTQKSRLLEIADRCPVHRTLERKAVIETRLAILSA